MKETEWTDLNVGDVLQHRDGHTYVVVDVGLQGDGINVVTRTIPAQNPQEWERVRKTVDCGGD